METSTPSPVPEGLEPFVRRFDHISIAVRGIAKLLPLLDLLGAAYLTGAKDVDKGYRWVQFTLPGGTRIELLEPIDITDVDHFLVRFLDGRGEGVHHLTFRVHDIHAAVDAAERIGYEVVGIDDEGDWKEAFLHPRSSHGVLIQLAQWEIKDDPIALEDVLGHTDRKTL